LSEMRSGSKIQATSKIDAKVYQRLEDVIDPNSEDALVKLLGEPAKAEIEVSFGSFRADRDTEGVDHSEGDNTPPKTPGKGPAFSPGLFSAYQFEALLSDLSKITEARIYNDRTEIMETVHTRKIVDLTADPENPTVIYQKKFRPKNAFVVNEIWGYRVSKSTEEFTEEPDFDFVPDLIRHRRRHTFVIRDSTSGMYGFQFDLSHIKEVKMKQVKTQVEKTEAEPQAEDNPEEGEIVSSSTKMVEDKTYIKYEVEIERVSSIAAAQRIPIENLANAIRFVLLSIQDVNDVSNLMTLQEIRDVVHTHNTLFSVDITKSGAKMNNPYRMFKDYWNKPTNIRVDDLLFVRVNDMSVTVKLDGVRQFLFITRNGTYALGPPTDLYCIDEGISKLDGTLLDTEKYTSPDGIVTYYAFDILFNRGASVRSAYFKERIAILDNIIDVINLEKKDKSYKVIRKHFYTNGTIYEKTIEALAWIEEHPEFSSDGLIFQPTHHYKNNHTKKWKPASQMTIDFMTKKVRDSDTGEIVPDAYKLYVSDKKGDVSFEGTEKYPYSEWIYVPDGIFDGVSIDDAIVECKWDPQEKNFVIYRLRLDRDRPNAYSTARDVWDDIMDPITRADIEGDSLRAMRRYHNMMKYNMLHAEFSAGARIMDWGSGRGGDLGKWADIGLEKVYVVEPNETNLAELERRKNQMDQKSRDKGKKNIEVEICRDNLTDELLGGEDTDALINVVSKSEKSEKSSKSGTGLDGIVAFFSLTFFGRDKERWDAMIDSLDLLLEAGGKVVGIVMDGERTRDLLEEERLKQGISQEEAVDYANKSFMISQISDFTDAETGNEIEIKIFEETSMVRGEGASGGQQEWLFYFNKFQADLESRGFVISRNGFLDTDPKKITSFDVLPTDSKTFSKLNRFFVFSRRARGIGRKGEDAASMKNIMEDEMLAFHTINGIENEDDRVDLYRIGTIRDASNFIHAVIRAFDQRYYDMTQAEKQAHIKKIRGMLGRKMTVENYDVLNDGEIAARFKSAAIRDLIAAGDRTPNDIKATQLGFLEYRLKVMDSQSHISADTVSELISNMLEVNIIMLKADGTPKVKLHGSRDCEFMRDVFYSHAKTILLISPDGVHYDLVAKVVAGEEEPSVYSVFSTDSPLITHLLGLMC